MLRCNSLCNDIEVSALFYIQFQGYSELKSKAWEWNCFLFICLKSGSFYLYSEAYRKQWPLHYNDIFVFIESKTLEVNWVTAKFSKILLNTSKNGLWMTLVNDYLLYNEDNTIYSCIKSRNGDFCVLEKKASFWEWFIML